MKAYRLSVKDEDDAGQMIVFADTVKEARKQIDALYERADTPEDCVAKLAIELFKQGILK